MPRSLMAERRGFGPEAPAPADLKHGHDQQNPFDPGNYVFNYVRRFEPFKPCSTDAHRQDPNFRSKN
jgi:hypothetical protein